MKFLGIFLTGILVAAGAFAQDSGSDTDVHFPQQLSAGDLLGYCASSAMTERGRQRQRYCAGFVSGIEEAARLLMRAASTPPPKLCVPPKETARSFREAYVRYAGRRSVNLDRPAALVVLESLQQAYPCPTG